MLYVSPKIMTGHISSSIVHFLVKSSIHYQSLFFKGKLMLEHQSTALLAWRQEPTNHKSPHILSCCVWAGGVCTSFLCIQDGAKHKQTIEIPSYSVRAICFLLYGNPVYLGLDRVLSSNQVGWKSEEISDDLVPPKMSTSSLFIVTSTPEDYKIIRHKVAAHAFYLLSPLRTKTECQSPSKSLSRNDNSSVIHCRSFSQSYVEGLTL
jgi:hypothetical protein